MMEPTRVWPVEYECQGCILKMTAKGPADMARILAHTEHGYVESLTPAFEATGDLTPLHDRIPQAVKAP